MEKCENKKFTLTFLPLVQDWDGKGQLWIFFEDYIKAGIHCNIYTYSNVLITFWKFCIESSSPFDVCDHMCTYQHTCH